MLMPRKSRTRSPERAKTDHSLRTERKNTDDALKGDRSALARDADEVVERARDVADAVLDEARRKADGEVAPPGDGAKAGVAGQRARADREILGARARADVTVRSDRKDQADALAALLVHERAATDAYLLTERVRSDEAVTHRDDFLAMVTHDVRNLLNGVVLSLELLQPDDKQPDAQVADAAARIRRYVGRMNRLIGDLVDVTSIDAGKLAMSPTEGDAGRVVAEATDVFQSAADAKGVSLSADLPDHPLPAEFDHDRMLQVFANLISNAIKFTPARGRITVRAETPRGMLRFAVTDTGVGIPEPMREAIFERFWQLGRNDRRGQGLGLYISKCIVEAHGGRIWAESEPGKGTTLFFTLPTPSSHRRGSGGGLARAKARPSRGGKKVADRRGGAAAPATRAGRRSRGRR
jgi:signal transduction histidine kinase